MNSNFLKFFEQELTQDKLAFFSKKYGLNNNSTLDISSVMEYTPQDTDEDMDPIPSDLNENLSRKDLAENPSLILEKIRTNTFSFQPFSEKRLRRGEKTRIINILAPKDKIIDHISFKYLENLYGLKTNYSIYKIALSISSCIKTKEVYFFRLDIKDFFGSIDHKILLDIIQTENDKNLLKFIESFLNTKRVGSNELNNKYKKHNHDGIGIPQGAAISQALSNLYLKNVDTYFQNYTIKNGDLYFRYVDDVCYLSEDENTVKNNLQFLIDKLESIGLKTNIKKQKSGKASNGFDYLGFNLSTQGISLSKKSIALIMSNYYNYYKKFLKNSSAYLSQNSENNNRIWRILSLAINSSIRGFNIG